MTAEEFKNRFNSSTKSLRYKRRIIEHIIDEGPDTLPSLSKKLELSVPTTSKYVNEMIDGGLMRSYGKLETSGGRHPFLFGLDPTNVYFLGVDFTQGKMHMMMMDFCGDQVQEVMDIPFKFENTPECLDEICHRIDHYIDHECSVKRQNVVSIGLNLFGRINPETGCSYTYFNFSERPLGELLTEHFCIPVWVDNDSRACAYGEYMTHVREEGRNILFINVTWGLGLGIIIDGKPYAGKSGFSGELGHIHAFENEVLCHCGKKGCLETEASGSAMYRKFQERIAQGDTSTLTSPDGPFGITNPEDVTLDQLIEATQREDILCIDILEEIGNNLGMHIAGLINLYNPDFVIIGGQLANTGDYFMQPLKTAIRKYSLNMVSQDTKLRRSLLMRYAGVVGACMLARKKSVEHLTDTEEEEED